MKVRGALNSLTRRVWLHCGVALFALSLPWIVRGGHTLLIPIGVHDPLPELGNAALRPLSLGLPVPKAANLRDLERIVLVGAEMVQYRPMQTWPDGAVRWLFIDALVSLPPGQQKAGLHLTTGQAGQPASSLAKLAGSQDTVIDNGALSVVLPRRGETLLSGMRLDSRPLAGAGVRLLSTKERASALAHEDVRIEKNGSVATTVALDHQLPIAGGTVKLTVRLSAFQGQSWIKLEISAHASETVSNACLLPPLALEFTGFRSPRRIAESVDAAGWRGVLLTQGTTDILVCSPESRAGADPIPTNDGLAFPVFQFSSEPAELVPGGWLRREWYVDLRPDEASLRRIAQPLLARGASPDAYNDAETLATFVVAQAGDTEPIAADPIASFGAFEDLLYTFLGARDPVRAGSYGQLRSKLDVLLGAGTIERSLPGEALSLWSNLTGDDCVSDLYLEWGNRYAQTRRRLPAEQEDAATLAQLLDVCNFADDASLHEWLLQRAEAWLTSSQSGTNPGRLIFLADLIRLGRSSASAEDRLLDQLEVEVYRQRQVPSSDRVFREGYLLTGNPQFLEEGARFLTRGEGTGASVSLRQLFAAPQRQHVWRDLPLQIRPAADGSVTLAWTVPARALRVRLKHAAQPIASGSPDQLPPGTVPFYAASNLEAEPELEAAGNPQQLRLPAAAGLGKRQFAARYLERGAALPGRTPEPGRSLPQEGGAVAAAWNWSIVMGVVAASCILAARLGRGRFRRCSDLGKMGAVMMICAACCGCGSNPTPSVPTRNPPPRLTTTSDGGTFRVTIAPRPDPIPLNEHFAVEVTLVSAASQTNRETFRVSVDASMPAHGHGLNTAPVVKELSANQFLAEGLLFHMAGAWELYVDIHRGPIRERAMFPITMRH